MGRTGYIINVEVRVVDSIPHLQPPIGQLFLCVGLNYSYLITYIVVGIGVVITLNHLTIYV